MGIKKKYEVKAVTKRVCVSETIYCDVCKRNIDTSKGYWALTTGHNDNRENIEHFDLCSEICLREKFDEYVKESGKDNWNSMYFEVERT